MLHNYIEKLIENLPINIKENTRPLVIDVVLDGGIFNGSYLIGALFFLKEMEKKKYIKIDRISGCSIGAIVAFAYFIENGLDNTSFFYKMAYDEFKSTYSLSVIKDIKTKLFSNMPDDICNKINNKLFITYNNLKKHKKIVKSEYKSKDDIINTIIQSCYIPYLIDGNLLYRNKTLDGINPYIFKIQPHKKILYLDLFGFDKITRLLNVKNEYNNYHRILSGLLDIHHFFIKKTSTQMCSYVNDWSCLNYYFIYLKIFIEKSFILFIRLVIYINKNFPKEWKKSIFIKILCKILQDVFIILLETYCI